MIEKRKRRGRRQKDKRKGRQLKKERYLVRGTQGHTGIFISGFVSYTLHVGEKTLEKRDTRATGDRRALLCFKTKSIPAST